MTREHRRVGRVTTKGPAEKRMRSADEGLLQRQEDPGFVHTDPWRVLRIMGEFVDGFDVLARVGLAVTVFGSARVKPDSPYYAAAREVGARHRQARLRGDHGRRARDHGGGQPRRQRGRRALDRLQHRAAARAVAQPLRESLDRLPLLLRAQDDVRQVLGGVRRLPGRLRHARRAVRGADADPDRQGQALPRRALRLRVLERAARLDPRTRCSPRAWSRTTISRSCRSSTRRTRCVRSPPAARRGERRARASLPARGRPDGRRTSPASWSRSSRRRSSDVAIAIYDFHVEHEEAAGHRRARCRPCATAACACASSTTTSARATRELPDNVPRPAAPPEYIDSLGLDVRPVIGFGTLMHHKYVVIDGERVWTGSMNWTEDSFTLQENCIVTLDSPRVAAAYLRDFEDLWNRPRHLDKSGRFDVDWSDATFDGQAVRVRPLFCPGRGPELASLIGSRIACARERVLICSPVLTSGPILGALSDVVGRGECPSPASSTARRCRTCCASGARLPKASWKPAAFRFVASQGAISAASAASRGGRRPCTTSCTRSSSCATTGPSPAPTTTRARARRTPRTCWPSTARPCADRVAEAIREFAARYATGADDTWASARVA